MPNQTSQKRIISLDILRAITILLMIWTHTVAFISVAGEYYLADNALNLTRRFGDAVCFTTLLLISGAALYLLFTKKRSEKKLLQIKNQLLIRTLKLLMGYYLIALVASLDKFQGFSTFYKIILFIEVPGYIEYLLPFLFWSLVIPPLYKPIQKILRSRYSLFYVSLISAAAYSLGFFLYDVDLNYPWVNYKALFAGHSYLLRYPILQYAPVFFLGLWVGKILDKKRKIYSILTDRWIVILPLVTLLFFINANFFNRALESFPYDESFGRWPPSLNFLSAGLTFALITLIIIKYIPWYKVSATIRSFLIYVGQNAFNIFLIHIIILQLYRLLWGKRSSSVVVIIIFYILIVFVSFLFENMIKKSYLTKNGQTKK